MDLGVRGQHGLEREFREAQGYTRNPVLNKQPHTKNSVVFLNKIFSAEWRSSEIVKWTLSFSFFFHFVFQSCHTFQSSLSNFFLCLLLLLPIKAFLTLRWPASGTESSMGTVLFGPLRSQRGVVECRLCVH